MRSLRSRLILGSALIAVIPLAAAIYLISRRIETMVRAQAAERLDATLGGLATRLASEGEALAGRIAILAREPQLRRLYLVRPAGSGELSEYLAERRFLLGLDFLQISDTSGVVLADGASSPSALAMDSRPAWRIETTGRGAPAGLTLERVAGDSGLAITGRAGLTLERVAGDSGLAITAHAPIRYEGRFVGVVEGGMVLDARYLMRLREASGVELVLNDAEGRAIAATAGVGVGGAVPAGAATGRVVANGQSYLGRGVPLDIGPAPQARITGLVSTASADGTIAALQWSAALLGLFGIAVAILLGLLWSSQVSRPVERLAAFSHRLAMGEWDEPLNLESVRELQTLVAALDRMRTDLRSYRERLVTSERQAAWGQMARKVAHEVRNPLTPIAVSVADLKRSYERGSPDFPQILDQAVHTIGGEVEALKRLLQEFSEFGRLPPPRLAPCRLAGLFDDLAALYAPDVTSGRLALAPAAADVTLSADAGQLRQALVNLIKNGLEALHGDGRVTVSARVEGDALALEVSDTGPGLTAEQRANLFVPGFTTKTGGSGLGLTIVERIVNDHQGTIAVDSGAGSGTLFRIRLPLEPSLAWPAAHETTPRT